MTVTLSPHEGDLRAHDRVQFDTPVERIEFVLNAGLNVTADNATIEPVARSADGLRVTYRASLPAPSRLLALHIEGKPLFSPNARAHGGMPQGLVSAQAIYLDLGSAWLPVFQDDIAAMSMHIELPDGWHSIAVGRREERNGTVSWTSDKPLDDVYLIAAPFTRYAREHGDIVLSVYLLDKDDTLAQRYLDIMGGYFDHYGELIGAYPYAKFAVIENPWQTGYGMPSFTLLGSRVLRLPFIPYTSLPHEILHNWWGNGVWIDYSRGNWAEGLTAYLADHWMQARRGKGAQYRLKALQRYSNFAANDDDMPLLAFTSRHDDKSQSVGYSKSLMLFHMLRMAQGEDAFITALRRLWSRHAFQRIGFAQALSTLTEDQPQLRQRMLPWIERTGAPRLQLADAKRERDDQGWLLTMRLMQDNEQPFDVDVPVLVTLDEQAEAQRRVIRLRDKEQRVAMRFDRRPLRIDVDPEFDVLRILAPTEQPPALNRLFGAANTWLVLPSNAPPEMQRAWKALAQTWRRRYPGLRVTTDADLAQLPPRANRLILGWRNRALGQIRPLLSYQHHALDTKGLTIREKRFPRSDTSIVLVTTSTSGVSTGFVGAPNADAINRLARKLPHYGSYGRLVFDASGKNLRKDLLVSPHSPLSHAFFNQ